MTTKKVLFVRVDDDLHAKCVQLAKVKGITVNKLCEQIIDKHVFDGKVWKRPDPASDLL